MLSVLLITLLAVSTVNATNIMANDTISDSVVHESHKSISLSESKNMKSNMSGTLVRHNNLEKTSKSKSYTTNTQNTLKNIKNSNKY